MNQKATSAKIFSKIAVYPGFVHGFTVRGHIDDEFAAGAMEDAKDEAVRFFRKFNRK
jgi:dienelactone hydrolase